MSIKGRLARLERFVATRGPCPRCAGAPLVRSVEVGRGEDVDNPACPVCGVHPMLLVVVRPDPEDDKTERELPREDAA